MVIMRSTQMSQTQSLLTRDCPVCGNAQCDPYLQKLDLHLVRCCACAMVYANPAQMEMASGSFYDHAGGEYLTPEKIASDYAPVRFERELRLFRAHCRRGSVLDVGCSSGGFLHQLQRRFPGDYTVLGTDVSSAPLAHAAQMGVPVMPGDFLTHKFTESFDAVTFWAVMEHLADPAAFLKKAAAILKPGGHCFILTPNLNSLAVRLLGAKYRYIFPEHLNYFTAATLVRFMAREMTVLQVKSTHFNPLVIWQDFHDGERHVPRAERVKLLHRTTRYKQSPWLAPVKLAYRTLEGGLSRCGWADNVAVVGTKG